MQQIRWFNVMTQEITIPNSELINIETLQTITPKRKTQIELTDQLIDLLFHGHKTFSQASKELGLTRPRAYRLWNKWKQSTEAQLVDTEWWDLYLKVKQENPEKALECLTRLKYRMITEKHELQATIKAIKLEWKLEPNLANPVHTSPETT